MTKIGFDLNGTKEMVELQSEAPEMFDEIVAILKTNLPKVGIELSNEALKGAAFLAVHDICNRYAGKDPGTLISIKVDKE